MTERQMQFRVGMLVLVATAIGTVLVFRFGDLRKHFEEAYPLAIHFRTAPGVYPSAPVQKSGITIGHVREVEFDDTRGGVVVTVEINSRYRLRVDSQPQLSRSLLGDTAIDFTPGTRPEYLKPGATVEGVVPVDPLDIVNSLEARTGQALDSLTETSREWQLVARNLNSLMRTKQGDLDQVIEGAAVALQQFTVTMQNANRMITDANKLLGDPATQRSLRELVTAMPELVNETRQTIVATRTAIGNVNANLENLNAVTDPLARRGSSMVARLDSSLTSLDTLLADLSRVSRIMASENGSLQKLGSDPELYRNLNRSAESLALVLKNLEPMVRDLQVFSDKIARHPEVMGVAGAMRPSDGLKDPEPPAAPQQQSTVNRTFAPR